MIHALKDFIFFQEQSVNEIMPALSFKDLQKKNELLPYYRGDSNSVIQKKGNNIEKKKRLLEDILTVFPRMPKVFYKILFRLIKI